LEFPVDGIADDNSVLRVNERHAIEESLRFVVRELQFPWLALPQVIDSRFVAGACGKQKDFGAKRFYASKIE
jgi:hypothetical protein